MYPNIKYKFRELQSDHIYTLLYVIQMSVIPTFLRLVNGKFSNEFYIMSLPAVAANFFVKSWTF